MSEPVEYELTVNRRVRNPGYRGGSGIYISSQSESYSESRSLHVVLREDEFEAVKQALVRYWAPQRDGQG